MARRRTTTGQTETKAKKRKPRVATKKTPGKSGPEPFEFSAEQIEELEGLSVLSCTDEEIAAFFGVTVRTFTNMKKRDKRIVPALQKGSSRGKISLRRRQLQRAMAGSDTMLIWLGKQLLGQRNVRAVELDVAPSAGGSFQFTVVPYDPETHGAGKGRDVAGGD